MISSLDLRGRRGLGTSHDAERFDLFAAIDAEVANRAVFTVEFVDGDFGVEHRVLCAEHAHVVDLAFFDHAQELGVGGHGRAFDGQDLFELE